MGNKAFACHSFVAFEFQTFLNIIGLALVTVISYGLWTCLGELEDLRKFNGKVARTIAQLPQRTDWHNNDLHPDWSDVDLLSDWTGVDLLSDWPDVDLYSKLKSGDTLSKASIIKSNQNLPFQRSKREISKGGKPGKGIQDFIHDPLSQTDRVNHFNFTLV